MLSVRAVFVQICFPTRSAKFRISLPSLASTVLFAHNSSKQLLDNEVNNKYCHAMNVGMTFKG